MKINGQVTDVEIPFPEDNVLVSKASADGSIAYADPVQSVRPGQCQYPCDDGRRHATSNACSISTDIIDPIVELRIRFGRIEPMDEPATVVFIVAVKSECGQQLVGIVVEAVSDVLHASDSAGTAARRYPQRMVSLQQGIVVPIDIDKVLSPHERVEPEAIVDGCSGRKDRNG
jgi:hypothetical protein